MYVCVCVRWNLVNFDGIGVLQVVAVVAALAHEHERADERVDEMGDTFGEHVSIDGHLRAQLVEHHDADGVGDGREEAEQRQQHIPPQVIQQSVHVIMCTSYHIRIIENGFFFLFFFLEIYFLRTNRTTNSDLFFRRFSLKFTNTNIIIYLVSIQSLQQLIVIIL